MDKLPIAFIGCGNMGRSLIGGLIADGYPRDLICGSDINTDQRKLISTQFNIAVHDDNVTAIQSARVVVIAVKPQVMKDTLASIKSELQDNNLLLISIAAGIRLVNLAAWTHDQQAIVRAMPNIPAMIQSGATALCANTIVNEDQRNFAEAVMRSVGLTIWLNDENIMDTVTALSGSGPAYIYLVMEAMEKAAIKLGLTADEARLLTKQTAFGATKMALESNYDPATLRQHVTSPGGTTESAIEVFVKGNLEQIFEEALSAAQKRSTELADQFGK